MILDAGNVLKEAGVKAGQTVADFGCGTVGHFVFPAGRIVGPNGRVFAIDVQPSVMSAIESRMHLTNLNNIEPLRGDMERPHGIPVPDQSMDVSLLINNLFFSKTRDALAEEVRRTTKLGGRLVVVDWLPVATPIGPPLADRLAAGVARDLFTAHGFTLDHPFTPGLSHWGLVFRRTS